MTAPGHWSRSPEDYGLKQVAVESKGSHNDWMNMHGVRSPSEPSARFLTHTSYNEHRSGHQELRVEMLQTHRQDRKTRVGWRPCFLRACAPSGVDVRI